MSKINSDKHVLDIPWGAWHKESTLRLSFPSGWDVSAHSISDRDAIEPHEINRLLCRPIGASSLIEIARGKSSVAIAVEDATRPAMLGPILSGLVDMLGKAGISDKRIRFIMCNGAHAPMKKRTLIHKLGKPITDRFLVVNHSPYDNLTETGVILGKTPVRINRFFIEADLRIAVGSIIPHSFAGFSGGAKLIMAGLADLGSLERSHKYVMMGFRGGVDNVEHNAFRAEIEAVAGDIGVDFFIGAVPNAMRQIAGVFVGDLVAAHRAGVEFARQVYATDIFPPYDIAILNAYPKDTELLQADTALTALKTCKKPLLKPNGTIVIVSKCSNGFGHHSLFGPGMRLQRRPIRHRFLNDNDLFFFSPNINQAEFGQVYWNGYSLFNHWQMLMDALCVKHPTNPRVCLLPCAPLQLLRCLS